MENKELISKTIYQASKNNKSFLGFYDRDITLSKSEGYDIQDELNTIKFNQDGDDIVGYKIGLTTTNAQKMYNTDEPFYGAFTHENIIRNKILKLDDMLSPKVLEMELVFLLDADLSSEADGNEIIEKCRIGIGIEIPDCRYENWFRTDLPLGDIIADSGVAGKLVIDKFHKIGSLEMLKNIEGVIYFNTIEFDRGHSSAVLGSPINTLLWLNEKLSERGKKLEKGMIVSSGSFSMPKPITKGTYKVNFSQIDEIEFDVI